MPETTPDTSQQPDQTTARAKRIDPEPEVLEIFQALEELDAEALIRRLDPQGRTHTFMATTLFLAGCDVDNADIIEDMRQHGARRASDNFRAAQIGHRVAVIDRFGRLVLIEMTPETAEEKHP